MRLTTGLGQTQLLLTLGKAGPLLRALLAATMVTADPSLIIRMREII